MKVSVLALYHPALWNFSYAYRTVLIFLRSAELIFIAVRFLFFRAPLLIVWTRLPGLRNIRPPYGDLGPVLSPTRDRAGLLAGEALLGVKSLGDCRTREDVLAMQEVARAQKGKARPTMKTLVGGVLRGLIIQLGSTFIKFGQILSMRPETPPFLREELQLMQDRLPPMSPKETRRCLQRELDKPVEEVFEYVDWTPIASASLAQVHRAKLRGGEEVALKIQRVHLRAMTKIDSVIIVDIVVGLARLILPLVRRVDVSVFTSSFRKSLTREIDFFLEARTQEKFYNLVHEHPIYSQTIKIAHVHWEYTTSKLITMELMKGYVRVDRLLEMDTDRLHRLVMYKIPEYPEDRSIHLFWSTAAFWGEMILNWGLVHGDPHLGNLYAMEQEDGTWKAFVCDFGMIEELPQEGLDWAVDLFAGLLYYHDAEMLVDAFTRFTKDDPKRMAKVDMDQVRGVVTNWLERRAVREDANSEVTLRLRWQGTTTLTAEIMYELLQIPYLRLPDWLWLVIKSLAYLEELGLTLWGNYDATDMFMPHVKVALRQKIVRELQGINVTNVDDYIEGLTAPLRRPDVAQLMTKM